MHFPSRSVGNQKCTVYALLYAVSLGTSWKSAVLCVITHNSAVLISFATESRNHAQYMLLWVLSIMQIQKTVLMYKISELLVPQICYKQISASSVRLH